MYGLWERWLVFVMCVIVMRVWQEHKPAFCRVEFPRVCVCLSIRLSSYVFVSKISQKPFNQSTSFMVKAFCMTQAEEVVI